MTCAVAPLCLPGRGNVITAAERWAGAVDQDNRDVVIGLRRPERVYHLPPELEAERVALLGAVERDPRDPVLYVVQDILVFQCVRALALLDRKRIDWGSHGPCEL